MGIHLFCLSKGNHAVKKELTKSYNAELLYLQLQD